MLTIQDCAESIATLLFTVCYGTKSEQEGDRLQIMVQCPAGEAGLGGWSKDAAIKRIEEELREWLRGMDTKEGGAE